MDQPTVDQPLLWNEAGEGYPSNEKWHAHLLDQYKLYVEMADRISNRRATANQYFLSVNSAILAFVGFMTTVKDGSAYLWTLAVAGLALGGLWQLLIQNYSRLNAAKWQVVQKIEKRLPISPYDAEWEAMGRGKDPDRYRPISHLERLVPWVFLSLHAFVFCKTFPYWSALWTLRNQMVQP
jgi:hypothetical protein